MFCPKHLLAVAIATGLLTAAPTRADFVSTFDTGLEGWTGIGGAVTFVAAGGNPGGFLRQLETDAGYMTVFAPAALLGNLSSFQGGTLSFDGRNVNGAAPDLISQPQFGTVTFSGPGGTASALLGGTGQPPIDGLWRTYSTPLNPALWTGNLNGALANVTEISVVLEFNEQLVGETAGFDNFALRAVATSAVPAPASLVLLGLGLAGLACGARRRDRSGAVEPGESVDSPEAAGH